MCLSSWALCALSQVLWAQAAGNSCLCSLGGAHSEESPSVPPGQLCSNPSSWHRLGREQGILLAAPAQLGVHKSFGENGLNLLHPRRNQSRVGRRTQECLACAPWHHRQRCPPFLPEPLTFFPEPPSLPQEHLVLINQAGFSQHRSLALVGSQCQRGPRQCPQPPLSCFVLPGSGAVLPLECCTQVSGGGPAKEGQFSHLCMFRCPWCLSRGGCSTP